MDLRDVRVRLRLDKGVRILLVFSFVVSEANKDGFIEPLSVAVCLKMICRDRQTRESE